MAIRWTTAFATRFLRDRTFELIVAPAIADFQYDPPSTRTERVRGLFSLVKAVWLGAYEDATSDSNLLMFAALVLFPACYYMLLVGMCLPNGIRTLFSPEGLFTVSIIVVMSIIPAAVCFWPEPHTPTSSPDVP